MTAQLDLFVALQSAVAAADTTITPMADATPRPRRPADTGPKPEQYVAHPCWHWCGAAGPSRRCHPGSLFGYPPTVPCLACKRPVFDCQAFGALTCSPDCAALWDELIRKEERRYLVPVAEIACRYLTPEMLAKFEERAQAAENQPPRQVRLAQAALLCALWSEQRGVQT